MLGEYSYCLSLTLNLFIQTLDFMRSSESHINAHITERIQQYCQSTSDVEKRSAFRHFYDTAKNLVFAVASRIAPNYAAAEDLSQEIWLKILRSVCSYRAEASFGAWLRSVALRTWLDMRKRPSEKTQRELCRVSLSESLLESGEEGIIVFDGSFQAKPDVLAEAESVQALIEIALQRLTIAEANVFRARHNGELSFREIAEELGVSDGTVKTLHFRAMKKLQVLLKPIFETSSTLS